MPNRLDHSPDQDFFCSNYKEKTTLIIQNQHVAGHKADVGECLLMAHSRRSVLMKDKIGVGSR